MIITARQGSKDAGFALVEVIVVFALLLMLASFAVPRLISLPAEARTVTTSSLGSTLRSRAARAHALWLAQGQPDFIEMDGEQIVMQHGYPSTDAIATTFDVDGYIAHHDETVVVLSRSRERGVPIPNCNVSYAGAINSITAPQIRVDTTGC